MTDHIRGPHRIFLVVPCYNEADRLDAAAFRDFLRASDSIFILFVDDGSKDETPRMLGAVCASYPERAAVLPLPKNQGKAEAVRQGILKVLDRPEAEFIGFWDADLATPLDTVERFVTTLRNKPEIEMVFGARVTLLGRSIERKPYRHYLGRVFATAVSVMLNLSIYDSQCGAKLFRVAPHTKEIFQEPFLSRWVFDVEILARYLKRFNKDSQKLEKVIYEYPLERWKDVGASKVRPTDFFVAFRDLIRIYKKYLS